MPINTEEAVLKGSLFFVLKRTKCLTSQDKWIEQSG